MRRKNSYFLGIITCITLFVSACKSTKGLSGLEQKTYSTIDEKKSSGGSSGMEQLSDSTFLVVYDLKSHKPGARLGLIKITEETINVFPIQIEFWDSERQANDLESICAIPSRKNEFLVAESGNWQGKLGRIFHIKVDINNLKAHVIGTLKLPMLHLNDFGVEGEQYEAIHCLPYSENERIIVLGERGGSEFFPKGIIKWGLWNIKDNVFNLEGKGQKGIIVDAPGNWTNNNQKRSITDMHVDIEGIIWASASEDQGDTGPFYSVIYKLGKINPEDYTAPIIVFDKVKIAREIYGFKLEALSGSIKGMENGLSFGTEDEIYGGVWRPLGLISSQ